MTLLKDVIITLIIGIICLFAVTRLANWIINNNTIYNKIEIIYDTEPLLDTDTQCDTHTYLDIVNEALKLRNNQ